MKKWAMAAAVAACVWASSATALEIRSFPTAPLYTYELDRAHGLSSLVVHNIAIINDTGAPITLSEVRLELRSGARVLETRILGGPELAQAAARGVRIAQSGMLSAAAFVFGGDALLRGATLAQSPTLAPGEALLLPTQTFAFSGARDQLVVRASGGPAPIETSITISSELSRTAFAMPLRGSWYLGAGPTPHSHHRWAAMEEFADDFVRFGANNRTHRGDGARLSDYYAYGQPVLAAAAGVIAATADSEAEDAHAMRQPGETQDAYMSRVGADQSARLARGLVGIVGNYIVIDHGNGEYSVYAHLKPGSVRVRAGQRVSQGHVLGAVGSSGNSTEPHLHFQVCNSADPLMCAGIPPHWVGLNQVGDDFDRAPQTGDFISGANPAPATP